MDTDAVFFTFEIAAAALLGVLSAVLAVMYAYAYVRYRRLFFLLLCVASFIFALTSIYTISMCSLQLTHTSMFSRNAMHLMAWAYIVVSPVAGTISFVGAVLLLRFVLSQLPRPNQALQPTAGRSDA